MSISLGYILILFSHLSPQKERESNLGPHGALATKLDAGNIDIIRQVIFRTVAD